MGHGLGASEGEQGLAGGRGRRGCSSGSGQAPPQKGFVLFQTGYGPSGLPHIGTFAEVFRTSLVRQAFARLSDLPTRLFAFSDDMDGLRAVPGQHPERGDGGAAPATAADRDPGSVRHGRELRPQHEPAPAGVPGWLRLRVRVRQRHRVLSLRPLQRGAAARARAPRGDPPGRAADARRRAARDLQPDPADLPGERARAAGADPGDRSRGRHRHLPQRGGPAGRAVGHWTARPSCSGAPTGRCAGPRSASTTRCTART